jgi:hypothetical protein
MNDNEMRARRAMQALRAADQQGMGRVAGGMGAEATDRLADLDSCTMAYRTWSPALIPGLLQTDAYAANAIRERTPSLHLTDLEKRVTHRRRRAEGFLAHRAGMTGTFAWFLIGEAAITRPLGDRHAHGEQLRHLLGIAQDYGNMVIQVLREDTPVVGTAEPFTIFHLDPGPVVGHLESLIGGWYTVASEDIARLHSAYSDMMQWAMTPADSRDFISEVLDTCWGHTSEHTVVRDSSSPRTPTQRTASSLPALPPAPSE